MKYRVDTRVSRLDLHDSTLMALNRQADKLFLTCDWAKFGSDTNDAIIMGTTEVRFFGVSGEKFLEEDKAANQMVEVPVPDDIIERTFMVSANEISDEDKSVKINAFFWDEWNGLEWSFKYQAAEISWNTYCTYDEWKNGSSPD